MSDHESCSDELWVTTHCSELLMGMSHRWREWCLCMWQRTGRVMMAEEDVLDSIRPGHDTNDIE